ncbi:hypothetical protein PAPHI01_0568 [Pancytospora philotis]|nr:hypothetical protein PAPHI01_0568 [Pancytospora philotis]
MPEQVYVRDFRRLGRVLLCLTNDSARVFSRLGMRQYDFSRLPPNYDNRCSILKLALKHYFEEALESSDAVRALKAHRSASFLQRMFTFHTRLPATGSVRDALCCEIYNRPKDYDWENIDEFEELKCAELPLEALRTAACATFQGFDSRFIVDPNSYEIQDKEIAGLLCKTPPAPAGTDTVRAVLLDFIKGELNYLVKLLDYSACFNGPQTAALSSTADMACFHSIVELQKELMAGLLGSFGIGIHGLAEPKRIEALKAQVGRFEEAAGTVIRPIREQSLGSLSEFILDAFGLFGPYRQFTKQYSQLIEGGGLSEELQDCFTAVIQKITGYALTWKSFLKYDGSKSTRHLYLKFSRYNKILNAVADRLYLEDAKQRLIGDSTAPDHADQMRTASLRGFTSCEGMEGEAYIVYAFDDRVYYYDASNSCVAAVEVAVTDMCVFCKRLYVFAATEAVKGGLFRETERPGLFCAVFKFASKESITEFRETFYLTKYKATRYNDVYCSAHAGTLPGIRVTSVAAAPGETELEPALPGVAGSDASALQRLHNIKVEWSDQQNGGVSRLTESEIFESVKSLYRSRDATVASSLDFIARQNALLSHIPDGELGHFSLYMYNEDSVPQAQKLQLFAWYAEHLNILLSRRYAPAAPVAEAVATANDTIINSPQSEKDNLFNSILYQNDILKNYCPGDITNVLSTYILILNAHDSHRRTFIGLPLEIAVLLFSLFIQRNLYSLFSPSDVQRMDACIASKAFALFGESVAARNRPFLSSIINISKRLFRTNRELAKIPFMGWLAPADLELYLCKILGIVE